MSRLVKSPDLFKCQTRSMSHAGGMVTSFVRYGYVPVMLFGVNGAAIALAHAPWAEVWMAALILIAVGLSFAAERTLPYSAEWNEPIGDGGRDFAHAFINETSLLLTVLVVPLLAMLNSFGSLWPYSLPFVLQVLIAIVVTDVGVTAVHVASHRGWAGCGVFTLSTTA